VRGCLRVLLLGLGLAAVPVVVDATPLDTTGTSQCEARGYAIDADPKGTNVRSAPRADAPIIGHLAPRTRMGSNFYEGVEFEIVGSRDGWFLIQRGSPAKDFTLAPANAADGRGWVSGRLVGVALSRPPLRAAPRRDAPVVGEMQGSNWGPDSAGVSAVHACQGKYVEVTAHPPGGKAVRGWSFAPCSNQLTTCDPAGPSE
jgi:hypothetical protein